MVTSRTLPNSDRAWMERALVLAREARGHVWPNPPVGCVVVKDGEAVAEAATHPGGRPHAERKAIDLAGQSASEATLFVTLEPCCHWGKTPPCTDAIIDAGISRVVCAVQDPDPRVNGGGFEELRRAGIDVTIGVGAEPAKTLMSGFFHRIRTGTPEVMASTVGPGLIPDGVDGVLVSRKKAVVLTTRSGTIESELRNPHHLLEWMGDLGLTTVAIPKQDAFWCHGQSHGDVNECNYTSKTTSPLREIGA